MRRPRLLPWPQLVENRLGADIDAPARFVHLQDFWIRHQRLANDRLGDVRQSNAQKRDGSRRQPSPI
jgi:hypothetical protein